ncbi:hypothetical protein C2R22_16085 [Salinigranum rubrum]|uniref:Uncharacterized protein n=1 Tax=Salinigranum rubrum TaxID=755307 RepID=A0A2I8VM55_9EURY|nr:hypothetical protein [Salinigranum rubrum]AUV82975.1 hypothetical protein C2R22_16085 [Salinigranum rubrum]
MDADTDGLPVDRLFGGALAAGVVVALGAYVAGVDLTFAVGTGLFVAVLAVAGGLAVLGR